MARPRYELGLLGGFRLSVRGRVVQVNQQCQRLITLLALNERTMTRPQVAGTLWPDCSEARAVANLRCVRWRMSTSSGAGLLDVRQDRLELAEATVVDVDDVERLGRLLLDRCPPETLVPDAGDFLRPLLPGWYDDWIVFERERREQLHRRYAEAFVLELLRRARHADALDIALHLVRADPLQEGGQRALVAVYCAENEHALATRQLERYRVALRQEFGPHVTTSLDVKQVSGLLRAYIESVLI